MSTCPITSQSSIYIITFPNAQTSEKAQNHEINNTVYIFFNKPDHGIV